MNAKWRAGNAVIETILGFAAVWVVIMLYVLCVTPFASYWHFLSFKFLGELTTPLIVTGLVTIAATCIFIFPYVCLRTSESVLRHPWRFDLEPALIAIASCIMFSRHSFNSDEWSWTVAMCVFAIPTSLASSFFFLRGLRRKLAVPSNRASFSV